MSTSLSKDFDLGPSKVQDSGSAFVLPNPAWLGIQTFVNAALELPTTLTLLSAKLPSKPTGGLEQFQDLVNAYSGLNTSCKNFENVTLPDSVTCASNLISYNTKVQVYYTALAKELEKYNEEASTPEEEAANATIIKHVSGVCNTLIKDAKLYEAHAKKVFTNLTAFSNETTESKREIVRLHKIYSDKFDGKDGTIKKLQKQLEDDRRIIKETQDEYDHDVVVAATSATYAFMPPFGTIAAAIVAGIYGDKAVKAKAKIAAYELLVKELEGTLAADQKISGDLTCIKADLHDIDLKIAGALPGIAKILALWTGINTSLGEVIHITKDNIQDIPGFLATLGIDNAKEEWKKASDQATKYREIAYIKVLPSTDTVKMVQSGRELLQKLKVVHNAL